MGMPSSVWFDRKQVSPKAEEDLPSIDAMCADIDALVDQEVKNGISRDRIIIGKRRTQPLSITHLIISVIARIWGGQGAWVWGRAHSGSRGQNLHYRKMNYNSNELY